MQVFRFCDALRSSLKSPDQGEKRKKKKREAAFFRDLFAKKSLEIYFTDPEIIGQGSLNLGTEKVGATSSG